MDGFPRTVPDSPGMRRLGILSSRFAWTLSVAVAATCRGRSCSVCPSQLRVDYGFPEQHIFVSPTLKRDDCRIKHVLGHELTHVRIRARALARIIPYLSPALLRSVRGIDTPVFRTADRGAQWWTTRLQSSVSALFDRVLADVQASDTALDSLQSYHQWSNRMQWACS